MKPAPFHHVEVATVEEALGQLREHGAHARVLAGGQSLVPLMNLRSVRPRVLVDINPISELERIDADGSLELGAMVRQAAALRSAEVRSLAPLLADVLRQVGYPATRARGTIGGSVAHADPVAELPAALVALESEIAVQGSHGERLVPAESFFQARFETAAGDDELVTRIRVPRLPRRCGWGFAEIAPRGHDFAIAGAACLLEIDSDRVCRSARIALLGVAERPVRAADAEASLQGRGLDGAALSEAARHAAGDLEPPSDVHASGRYRREVAEALVRRALAEAARRGGGGS